MDRTPNLGLSLPTFKDPADIREIASDNRVIDGAVTSKISNNDYKVLRLDGGNMLKGGENVYKLPVGVYWTAGSDISETLINKPILSYYSRAVIEVKSSNGLNNGWNTITWQSYNHKEFIPTTYVTCITEEIDVDKDPLPQWIEVATLSKIEATNWDSGNLPLKSTNLAYAEKPERYDVPFLPDYTAHNIGVNAVWVNQFNEVTLNVAVARKDGKNIEVGLAHIAKLPVGTRPSSHIYTRGYQNDNGIIVGNDGGINLRIDIPANYVGFSVSYIAEK